MGQGEILQMPIAVFNIQWLAIVFYVLLPINVGYLCCMPMTKNCVVFNTRPIISSLSGLYFVLVTIIFKLIVLACTCTVAARLVYF